MKNPFTLHQVMGYFIPGLIFILLLFFSLNNWDWIVIKDFLKSLGSTSSANNDTISSGITLIFFIIITVFSLFIGLIFDALRNGSFEDFFDDPPKFLKKLINMKIKKKNFINKIFKCLFHWGKNFFYIINWNYFKTANADEKEILYGRYYTYYVFDMNMNIGLFIIIILSVFYNKFEQWGFLILLFSIFIFLLKDAASLRKEISELTNI